MSHVTVNSNGSSPLTRGKRHPVVQVQAGVRLIPAHAGKTRPPGDGRTGPAAHPRSRGENVAYSDVRSVHAGSSPLTRGKQGHLVTHGFTVRLIPAHAGKTGGMMLKGCDWPAHPRSRGENCAADQAGRGPAGSSPLTRGKPRVGPGPAVPNRLIPAHAGKTRTGRRSRCVTSAHPRSRGENSVDGGFNWKAGGSSPLTRGKLCDRVLGAGVHRLIPAHAGKTL